MQIRNLTENDLTELMELYKHYTKKDSIPPLTENRISKIWKQINDNPLISYFVGTVNGRLISSCILSVTPSFIRGGDAFGIIEHVVVHTDYRRKGFGKAIVKHSLNYAWKSGCTEVMLLSGSNNENAHKMYAQIGFDESRKKGFVIFNPESGY